MNTRMVLYPNPLITSNKSEWNRTPPRAPEKQQSDYLTKFDYNTIFFDVFMSNGKIRFSGPPLLNLKNKFNNISIKNDSDEECYFNFDDINRTQRSWLESPEPTSTLKLVGENLNCTLTVGPDLNSIFKDSKVLLTLSKDNELIWIKDWVAFHVSNQDIDSVLIYDNGSEAYGPEDVLETLSDIVGLKTAIVVHWPFPYGPQGGDWGGVSGASWDSDYCQHGMFEHARNRFLSQAAGVLQLDVDELLVRESGQSVFDVMESENIPAVKFHGMWIETFGAPEGEESPRFHDYRYFDVRRIMPTKKWAIRPTQIPHAIQWLTHDIEGIKADFTAKLRHRHFMGITNNWKHDRNRVLTEANENLKIDEELASSIIKMNTYVDSASMIPSKSLSRNPDVVFLENIEKYLIQSDMMVMSPLKIWKYTESCLVIDFDWIGHRIGFDAVARSGNLELSVVGRGAKAATFLDGIRSRFAHPMDRGASGRIVLRVEPKHREVSEIASMVNISIKSIHNHVMKHVIESMSIIRN